jgi:predicted DsbA family dithiol-disulfide isomerase
MKRLAVDLKGDDLKKTIRADMAEFEKMDFTGTLAFIVNGAAMSGAQPAVEFEKVIVMTTNPKVN